ncbi:MAG TPA: extracellular solute-binding protein [Chloroflexota bacterium]|nr:extracellular solute-binding protein [Chloroflexota bacterium]
MALTRRHARSFGQERGTRRAVLAAGVGSGGALLAACGAAQGGASTGGATEPAKTRPAVTLEYWSRWGLPTADVENKRVAEWNTANGPTKVERTSIEPYIDKLNTAFAGGAGPDVYTVGGSGMANFAGKGVGLNFAGYQAVQKELPDFFPATIEASKYQGKHIAMPYILDVRAIIYRKDFMRDAGLDPAKFPDTWDQFRDAARRLTKRDGGALARSGFDVPKSGWNSHDLFMLLTEMGGEKTFSQDLSKPTFNGPAGRQALQLMVDMVNKDQVDGEDQPKPPSGSNGIIAGTHAMTWTSAGPVNVARRVAPELLAQIGTAPIPKLAQRWTLLGGTWLMVTSKPKDVNTSVDLMLYLTAAKHADDITSVQNAVPPRKSGATSPYVTDPLIKTFYDAVSHAWAYPNHAFYTEMREVIVKEVAAAIKQEKSVQAALDDATRGTQDYLSRK